LTSSCHDVDEPVLHDVLQTVDSDGTIHQVATLTLHIHQVATLTLHEENAATIMCCKCVVFGFGNPIGISGSSKRRGQKHHFFCILFCIFSRLSWSLVVQTDVADSWLYDKFNCRPAESQVTLVQHAE